MDFHSMKRKQLQALCKKHNIPANLSNLEMATKLTDFLQEKENPIPVVTMEEEEVVNEAESDNVVVDRKVKKVRFSPEHELIEFSREVKRRSKRNSIYRSTDSNCSVEIVECGQANTETLGRRVRTRRSGELTVMEEGVEQKKRGVKAIKCNDGKTIALAVETFGGDQLEEGNAVEPGRVTRARGKMEAQGLQNISAREKKVAKDNIKRDDKAKDDVEKNKETVDNLSRVTRSRAQKLAGAPSKVGKGVVKNIGYSAAVMAEAVDNGESASDSLSKGGDGGQGTSATVQDQGIPDNGVGLKGKLVKKQIAGEHVTVEPQVVLRRSKRRGNMVDESEICNKNTEKRENGGFKDPINTSKLLIPDGSGMGAEVTVSEVNSGRRVIQKVEPQVVSRRSKRRGNMVDESENFNKNMEKHENGGFKDPINTSKLLISDGSGVGAEVTASEVNPGRRVVQKVEERINKVEPRRSNRRKTVVGSDNLKAETENKSPLRTSVPQSDVVPGVSKNDKMALQPDGVMRRSRRKTLHLKLDSASDINSAVENLQTEESVGEPCLVGQEESEVQKNTRSRILETNGGYSYVHQNDKVMKRKRGYVSGGDVITKNSDHSPEAQSLKGSSNKKVVSEVDSGRVADEGMQPRLLDNTDMLEASSHSSSKIEEALSLDIQLPVSKDPESACSMKEEVSIADIAGSYCMNLINGVDLANSGINAACKIERDSTVSDQNCTSDIREVEKDNLQLEFDAQQATEKNKTDVDKNPQTQVHSQMEDSCCNNKNNDQICADGLCVSGKDGSDEALLSGGGLLLDDQTDVKSLKESEIEAGDCLQPCTKVDDPHNDLDHLEASNNFVDDNSEDASQTAGGVGTFVSYETDYTHSMGALNLKGAASSMTSHHGDTDIEELVEADEDGCSKDCGNASSSISEYDMTDLCNGETCEGETSEGHISKCDEDGEFCLSNLFDGDGCGVTPHYGEKIPGETLEGESSKGHKRKCDEDEEFSLANLFDLPAPSTVCVNHNEVESGRDCSNSLETNPSTPFSVSETRDAQNSQFAISNALANSNKPQATWSNANELSVDAVCFSKSYAEGKISQGTEGLSADEDDKEDSAGAFNSDVKNCLTSSKIDAESPRDIKFPDSVDTGHHEIQESKLSGSDAGEDATTHTTQRKRLTKIELNNLFGTTSDEDTSLGLDDTSCHGSQVEYMAMAMNKSTTNNSGSLMKQKGEEMEGESQNESAKTNYKDVVLPTGFNADIYENELKFLFATPVKTMTPSKIEDASVTSIKEGSNAMKEIVATESTLDENARNAEYDVEDNSCIGASLFDYCGDDICEERNDVESFISLNTSTTFLSGCDVLEDQLAQNKEECMQDTIVKEEDKKEHDISLAQSCLEDEATEENIISSSGSPWDLHELESCTHMSECLSCPSKANNKSKREMIQDTEAVVGTSDSDPQMSGVPENRHLLSACSDDGNILRETLVETSSDPEEENNKSKRVIIQDTEAVVEPSDSDPQMSGVPENRHLLSAGFDEGNILSETLVETSSDPDEANDKYMREMIQDTEAVVEPSDSDPQMSGVPENRYLLAAGSDEGNILRETLVETSNDPEEAIIGSFQEDVADKEGLHPFLFSNASPYCEKSIREIDDQYDSMILDEKDGSPKLSQEHDSFVFTAVSGPVSSLPMPTCLEYNKDDDADLEAGEFKVESAKLKETSTTDSKSEYDGCEVSEDQLTENTGGCEIENTSITEDHVENVDSLGQSSLSDGGADHESEAAEENAISLSGSPNNLDKLKGCQDMLTDTALSQRLSCNSTVDHKSDQEMAQRSEAACELSEVDLQKSNFSKSYHLSGCFEDDKISEEASLNTSNISSFDGQSDEDASPDDFNGAEIPDEIDAEANSLKDTSDEPIINSEVEILKTLPDNELESAFLEAKEMGTTTQDPNTIIAPAEHGSPVCGAISSILSSSDTHLHPRQDIDDFENLDEGITTVFNLNGDDDKKNTEPEENSSEELHFEENVADMKNDTISNSSASECNEMLKESDVADTIKEYIDSESSLPMIFENSTACLSSDMLAQTDEMIACVNSMDEDITPSVDHLESEIKEHEEAALSMEPAQVSGNAANSSAEGSAKLETGQMSSSRSTLRKNARTILIHGTPNKLLAMADMKENPPTQKKSNMGDITAARPAKRKALQKVPWK